MVQTVQASKGQNNDLLSSLANNLSNSSSSFSSVLQEIRSNNAASAESNIGMDRRVGNNYQYAKKIKTVRPADHATRPFKGINSKVKTHKEKNLQDDANFEQAQVNAVQAAEPKALAKVAPKKDVASEKSENVEKEAKSSNNDINEYNNEEGKAEESVEAKVPPFMEVIALLKSAYQNSNNEVPASKENEGATLNYLDNNLLKLAGLLDNLNLSEAESEELGAILSQIEVLPDDALAAIKETLSKMVESGSVELAANEVSVEGLGEVELEAEPVDDKSVLVEALQVENNKSSNQILGNVDSTKSEVQNIVNKFIVFLGSVKALESANSSENVVANANENILEAISSKEVVEAETLPNEELNIQVEAQNLLKEASMEVKGAQANINLNSEGMNIVKDVIAFIDALQATQDGGEEGLQASNSLNNMPEGDEGLQLNRTENIAKENISSSDKFASLNFVKAEAVKEVADVVKNAVASLEESVEAMDIASEDAKEAESTEKYQAKAESKSAEVSTKAQASITSEALKKDFKLSSVEMQDNRAERVEEADAKSVTVQGKDSSSLNSSLNNGSNNGANMQQAANNQAKGSSQNSLNTENVIKTDFNSLLKASNEVQVKEAALQKEVQSTYNLQSSRDIEKLTKLIESSVSKAEAVLKVRLTPENLGKLQIELTEQGGKISAKILADNENSHKLIMSQSELLKNQLAEKGIVIDSMEFAFSDAKSKEENAFAKSNRNGKQQRNGKDNKNDSEEVGTDIANNKSDRLYA